MLNANKMEKLQFLTKDLNLRAKSFQFVIVVN